MRPRIVEMILDDIEDDRAYKELLRYIEQLEENSFDPTTHVAIPIKPSQGVLMSMAVRSDHGLAVPGYYDQFAFAGSAQFPLSHKKRLEGTLSEMSQLYEEVTREGFYKDSKEQEYVNMMNNSKEGKGHV